MHISIVTTIYNSSEYINEFYERIVNAASLAGVKEFEIIIVDDGSSDNSVQIAREIANRDQRIVLIELSRNFGHHKALMTAMGYASGEYIFLIDSDLEEAPENLKEFVDEYRTADCDVIYAVQQKRKGGLREKYLGKLFFYIFKKLSGLSFPENVFTSRLMSRDYVNALLLHKEQHVYLIGLWEITGFKQKSIILTKKNISPTSYTISKKISLAVDAILSFSGKPLKLLFVLGCILSFFSCLYLLYALLNFIINGDTLSGWTSTIISIWVFGSLNLLAISTIGAYVQKIYLQTKNRPYTIVKKISRNNKTLTKKI